MAAGKAAPKKTAAAVETVSKSSGPEIYIDPELLRLRDEEIEAAKETAVPVEPRPEPTIDPKLLEVRDREIALAKRRGQL